VTDLTDIVRRIAATIDEPGLEREDRIGRLKLLARQYWKTVFPEFNTPDYATISIDDHRRRWAEATESDGTANYPNADKIHYVLDWPGCGGDFFWVD
jgi:hypothetical protein